MAPKGREGAAAPRKRRGFAADRLKADIHQKVATGEMPPGTRVSPARELARDYSLSYATCHKALAELEAEGMLVRQQGRGTFVAEPAGGDGPVLRARLLDPSRRRARTAST